MARHSMGRRGPSYLVNSSCGAGQRHRDAGSAAPAHPARSMCMCLARTGAQQPLPGRVRALLDCRAGAVEQVEDVPTCRAKLRPGSLRQNARPRALRHPSCVWAWQNGRMAPARGQPLRCDDWLRSVHTRTQRSPRGRCDSSDKERCFARAHIFDAPGPCACSTPGPLLLALLLLPRTFEFL